MLDEVLSIVVDELNTYIGAVEPDVMMGNISLIDAFQDASAQSLNDRVIASIVNIEQEGTLRNIPYRRTTISDAGLPEAMQRQPEIYLNIYILFGANKSDYGMALQRVSQVIAFFQRKFVFSPANTPGLDPLNIDKLVFDLYSTSFEELNQLWGVMGGKYIPSVVYKMRLAMIQDSIDEPTGIVREIEMGTGIIPTHNKEA